MEHDYSLAHLTVLSLTPPQVIDVAARAGYRYASLRITQVTPSDPLYDLARDRMLMRETKARLDDTGVEVLDVELFRMDPTLGPDDFVRELEAAAELGARNIIAQVPDPDRERALARYVRLCELARPLDIFASLEFPHWTETGSLAEAARIVRVANQANAAILVDMLHMGRSNSSCDELKKLPREWFRFAHVCDAEQQVPRTKEGMIRTAREERLFPGEGTIDVCGILECLPPTIPYSLEIPRVTLTKAIGPEEVARLALVVSKSHLKRQARANVAQIKSSQAPLSTVSR
jgi:sugar phosphate isomerase/epimerase